VKAPLPKSRRARLWLVTAAVYLLFAVFVWLLGGWLALGGASLWLLRFGLWALGLIAAGLVLWFFAGWAAEGEPGGALGGDDVDTTLTAAAARLASARAAGARELRSLPMFVVLGPEASTKTTVVVHSQLEPDLLAGEVFRGDRIGPTPGVNVWFTQHTVFLEAGGKLAADSGRWSRLLRRVRPRRLRATLTGKPQAPRAALVCYSCEEFLKPGGAEAVAAAARDLRTLLLRMAQGFGVQLPVYVLFTKADRIPYFADFAHHLSREEAQQALGVTERWPARTSGGVYADRQFQRLNAAFDRLLAAVAAKRLDLLARETETERQAGLYEFPRELRKIVPSTIQFLVDLCRPSQLEVGPVLRGFYYTGVRAVVVGDGAPVAPARTPAAAAPGRIAATQAFDARAYEAVAAPSPAAPTAHKAPQWLFLGALFRDVLLRDRAPLAAAQGARSVAVLRRAGLTAAAVLFLMGGLWSLVQYVKNGRAVAAARELATVAAGDRDLPPLETLNRLETVRTHLGRLSAWRRWWWYKGTGLYGELLGRYQDRFNQILLEPARLAVLRSLDSLPEAPNAPDQYGRAYELLKAYLMTTNQSDKLTADFVVPVLMDRWRNGRQLDPARTELARRQFNFYASQLCRTASCVADAEARVVDHARAFLGKFTGLDRVYTVMISDASAKNPGVQFSRKYPGAAGFVTDTYEVPGAFTDRGWASVQDALRHVDEQAEDWVVGEQPGGLDRAQLVHDLRTKYIAEYIARWQAFLGAASVAAYGSPQDGARKLAQLGGNQSPLLQLLLVVAQNTAVDAATVGGAFQPVHVVMPPTAGGTLVVKANRAYADALKALGRAVEQGSPGAGDPAVRNAQSIVDSLAGSFRTTGDAAAVGTVLAKLLNQPIASLSGIPVAGVNGRGAQFCRSFGPVLAKYPFRPDARVDATVAEVAGIFEPNTGALWQLYNDALHDILVKQGAQFVPKAGAAFNLTSAFVRFFNRLAAVTDALWPPGAKDAGFEFTLKLLPSEAVPTETFSMDGQVHRFTRTFTSAQLYRWSGATARDVQVSGEVRGREETLVRFDGTWALFKLLQRARWQTSASPSVVQWVVPVQGQPQPLPVQAELNLAEARPILKGDYFLGMSCVGQIVH